MKKPLKFPCAIAMSEIDSQEVYDKVFNAFIEAGAKDCENYNDPDNLGMGYCYFGVDSDQETIHWNNLEDYDADDCSNGYVAIYSLGDILGTTDQQEALSEPLGDVLEPNPNVGIEEVVSSPQPLTGASVKIEFTICVGGVEHKVSRDEAFKVYQDLQSIFEKEVV